MFSVQKLHDIASRDKSNKALSSKSKKSTKRKRKFSKRESDSEDCKAIMVEEKQPKKENQVSNITNHFTSCNENNSSQKAYKKSKEKKILGVKSGPNVVSSEINGTLPRAVKKQRRRKKKKNVIETQVQESECSVVKDIQDSGNVKKNKKKRNKQKPSMMHQESECSVEKDIQDNGNVKKNKKKRKKQKPSMMHQESECSVVNDIQDNGNVKKNKKKRKKQKPSMMHPGKNVPQSSTDIFNHHDVEDVRVAASRSNPYGNSGISKRKPKSMKKGHFYKQKILEEMLKTKEGEFVEFMPEYKKEKLLKTKEEMKASYSSLEEKLIRSPAEIVTVSEDTAVVILIPGQFMYLQGLVSVRLLIGQMTVLGYSFEEKERQTVFSFNSHALLSVKAVNGCKLSASQHAYLLDYGLTEKQFEDLISKQKDPVVVFELNICDHPILEKLSITRTKVMKPRNELSPETLWGTLVTEKNSRYLRLTRETEELKETVRRICLYFECGNAPRVVLCGGKGVGKSTLFRYIVNSLLGKNGTKVQCLDLDPGQTEFSLPSCISLTQVTEPLLGPPYTHQAKPSSPNVKQIMIGGASPQFGLQRYLKALKHLHELSKAEKNCPLVVNTMGWTVGTGFDLILDTIRIVQPTHVIQLQSFNWKNNFDIALSSHVVQDTLGGVVTKPGETELHYTLTEMQSESGGKEKFSATPKKLRDIAVLVHLSDLVSNVVNSDNEEVVNTDDNNLVIVQWAEKVLHVCGLKIPRQRILQVLNGSLVALCEVECSNIESVGPDLPKQLIDDLDFGECIGWGVIRGIDPLTKKLHILTALTPEMVSNQVNAIIMPQVHLPDTFYGFFTQGEGPYYQTMCRMGAGRLKIGRQIKPHMATLGAKKHR